MFKLILSVSIGIKEKTDELIEEAMVLRIDNLLIHVI
jgi:hypothetical protein